MDREEKQRLYEMAAKLRSEQDFGAAAISGMIAMILAAGVYGVAKFLSEGFYYSLLAAGVGLAVGFAMQWSGKGLERKYAVTAMAYSLLGCMLGSMFAVLMQLAQQAGSSPLQALLDTPLAKIFGSTFESLPLADLMFWIIGTGAAAFFARRPLTREEGLALYTWERR